MLKNLNIYKSITKLHLHSFCLRANSSWISMENLNMMVDSIEQFYESTTNKIILMKICKDNIQVNFGTEYFHQLFRMNVILFHHYKGINYFIFIYFKRDSNIFEEFLNLSLKYDLIKHFYNQISDYLDVILIEIF